MDFTLTQEQKLFRETVYRYGRDEVAPLCEEADLRGEFSFEIWNRLASFGIFGLPFPEELGGSGADIVTCCLAGEALGHAGVDGGSLLAWGAHTYLCAHKIFTFGTDEQKKKFLAPVASGQVEGCYALTEANAGSDAASLRCRAELKGDRYIVNGTKTFITNGNVARYCVLAATTDPSQGYKGIINLLVDLKETPGFQVGKVEEKMGILASGTAELVFEDAEVPAENLLGKPGQGFRQMLSGLDAGRIGIGAQACGIGRASLDDAVEYAKQRVQF